ncbi:RAC family serine/threonine-protein kinase-like protein [Diplonema papillatum]|nr:RAC family serine/threonine-protein kinase-like protein [Diplonema papillatum]
MGNVHEKGHHHAKSGHSEESVTPVSPGLKPATETQRVLQQSWDRIKERGDLDRLGAVHYARFLEKGGQAARKLFSTTDMRKQQHVIAPVVEWVLSHQDPAALHALGLFHAHLGVTREQLEIFAQCFVDTIVEVLGDDAAPGLHKLWEDAMHRLTTQLSDEIEQCTAAIKGISDDKTKHGVASRSAAHKLMRTRTQSANIPVIQPDKTGWLWVSMYSKHHIKPPKKEYNQQHTSKVFESRFCELKGQFLFYRLHEGDKPEGVVDLSVCELIDTSEENNKLPSPSPYSFALRSHELMSYPWYFLAKGDDEKESWFARLRRSCNRFSFIRSDLYAGQRVWINMGPSQKAGVCRWTGKFGSEEGLWVGVELDEAVPDGNNGSHRGLRYFDCPMGKGLFSPAFRVWATSPLEIQVQGASLPMNTYTPAQFEFLKVIGKGSFGRVCKVREASTGQVYAVKILQKAALLKESQITNVRREKSILLNITHPFIVKLHAAFQTKGRLFLLFDFLPGGELFHHVQACPGSHLTEHDARFYVAEVSLAISHLHSINILHRDLKAENLVLDKEGHCVLTDFGFAKTVLPTELNTTRCGTLPYMAPEILRQSPVGYGFEVDWWALGVLLFLLLTGCYPFWHADPREAMKQILSRNITMTTFPIKPRLTEQARRVVLRLIDKDPATRLCSIEDFKELPWFHGFDWELCAARKMQPPFVPDQAGSNTKYFDLDETGTGASKPLPKGWSREEAFASFYAVHEDYKKVSQKGSTSDVLSHDDNERFIRDMNNWSMSEESDRNNSLGRARSPATSPAATPAKHNPAAFVLDT